MQAIDLCTCVCGSIPFQKILPWNDNEELEIIIFGKKSMKVLLACQICEVMSHSMKFKGRDGYHCSFPKTLLQAASMMSLYATTLPLWIILSCWKHLSSLHTQSKKHVLSWCQKSVNLLFSFYSLTLLHHRLLH